MIFPVSEVSQTTSDAPPLDAVTGVDDIFFGTLRKKRPLFGSRFKEARGRESQGRLCKTHSAHAERSLEKLLSQEEGSNHQCQMASFVTEQRSTCPSKARVSRLWETLKRLTPLGLRSEEE
jgi:hypothetical protein